MDEIRAACFRRSEQMLQHDRSDPVIGIDKGDVLPVRVAEPGVERRRMTAVFLRDDLHLRKTPGVFPQNFAGAVGGAVVDGDQFEIPDRLRRQRIQRFRQIRFCIVNGEYDGD